jgi:hypothetical protein
VNASSQPPAGQKQPRGPVVALLVTTVLVLAPLVYGLCYVSQDALACFGRPARCSGRRDEVMSLVHAGLALVGAPVGSAMLLGVTGALLRRRAAVWAATGALLGALAMWFVALYVVGQAFSHWEF